MRHENGDARYAGSDVEPDEEYRNRQSRIDMDYIHSTLQECLNGNVDRYMVGKSLALVEKHRDEVGAD